MKFTKKNVKAMLCRLVNDCDECSDTKHIKFNILTEAEWLGFRINTSKRKRKA